MLGELNKDQIENVLRTQLIGRIGCHSENLTYIVPVTYVYDGTNVFAHSSVNGMKMDMMRKNPAVCFEVDSMQNLANWQSVIAWGRFEEITSATEKQKAMQKLIERLLPFLTSETAQPTHGMKSNTEDMDLSKASIYKIKIDKKTGRFEKR